MRIFIDMDGVLVNFIDAAFKAHGAATPDLRGLKAHSIQKFLDLNLPEFWAPFNTDFWANLEPYPWVDELLDALSNAIGFSNLCLLSNPGNEFGAKGKTIWIREQLPDFYYAGQFLLGPSKHFCASPTALLIDDHKTNVNKFTAALGGAVLFPQPWNTTLYLDVSKVKIVMACVNQWKAKLDYDLS